MSGWRKGYWTVFNSLGRVVGALFILAGVIFVIYGASDGGSLFVVPGLVVSVLGVLLIFAKPYRPSVGDSASSEPADSHKTD
jgi:hypothetical protein